MDLRDDQLRAIAKAAGALRFVAAEWEWTTEAAKAELRSIAGALAEIESCELASRQKKKRLTEDERRAINSANAKRYSDAFHQTARLQQVLTARRKKGY